MDSTVAFTPTEHAVLLFLVSDERILLIHKKRGLGQGKINAPGGRVEPGESPEQAAVRETWEEVELRVGRLTEHGVLRFTFTDGYSLEVTVFTARSYEGTPAETAEALPFWCPVGAIPYERMWADDRLWLPHVLAGNYVRGQFTFDSDEMLDSELSVADMP